MAKVTETIHIDATPDQVWEMIGEFNGLNTWHPAVAKSEQYEEGGVVYRKLTLGDGAVVIESMDDHSHDRRSSTYTMTEMGPMPLAKYQATITVKEGDSGTSIIEWSGTYEPKGAPDDEVAQTVSGIYTSGFGAIADRFGTAD